MEDPFVGSNVSLHVAVTVPPVRVKMVNTTVPSEAIVPLLVSQHPIDGNDGVEYGERLKVEVGMAELELATDDATLELGADEATLELGADDVTPQSAVSVRF